MKLNKIVYALAFVLVSTMGAFANRFVILHAFTGGAASGNPAFQLARDSAGNLYGTTFWGGNMHGCSGQGCGVVYRLSPNGNQWTYTELYQFAGYKGGFEPFNVILDGAGNLYGVLDDGGANGFGLVYELSPTSSGPWKFTDLHDFAGGNDGSFPVGGLVFDGSGNLYGTARYSTTQFSDGDGNVFELSPQAGGGWSYQVIYALPGTTSSYNPTSGLTIDAAGNLYGATSTNNGAVFKLTQSGGVWAGTQLHAFSGADGEVPESEVTVDAAGNLYGTTVAGGGNSLGTVFELSPSGSGYTFSVLHAFSSDEGQSYYSLTLDASGNLLGVADNGTASIPGVIFKLVHTGSTWTYGTLHVFSGTDGSQPNTLISDGAGNFYGVANYNDKPGCINNGGCGVVFKLGQ